MNYICNASTNVGNTRESNQDSVILQLAKSGEHSFLLAAVCDGMGGLYGGEIASATVVCALKAWFAAQCAGLTPQTDIRTISASCARMMEELNQRMQQYELQRKKIMGTTMSCMIALDEAYTILHIGDSRIYRIGQYAQQLTTDHTLVAEAVAAGRMTPAEAAVSKDRNKLTQCVAASRRYEPEILFGRVQPGEVYLLCSDGFRHYLNEQELHDRFCAEAMADRNAMYAAIETAFRSVMEKGEKDNLSAAVIKGDWRE